MLIEVSGPTSRLRQNGQATTEYILLLAVGVTLALMVIKNLLVPAYETLQGKIGPAIERRIFNPKSFHQLRIGR
ncbi:MAG: hypothetical protein AAB425_11440 [Bdellovibrionota bacterium]